MNGPEHRWRTRLDARAARRAERRRKPLLTVQEQFIRNAQIAGAARAQSPEEIQREFLEGQRNCQHAAMTSTGASMFGRLFGI